MNLDSKSVTLTARPTNKLCQAVDLVKRMMESTDVALSNGAVYKKPKICQKTYIYCGSVRKYLMRSLENKQLSNEITPYIQNLVALLSDGDCGLIKQIKIDYDYIECMNGMYFDILGKRFVKNPPLKGSPRAYVKYKVPDKVPYPKPFAEGKNLFTTLFCACKEKGKKINGTFYEIGL